MVGGGVNERWACRAATTALLFAGACSLDATNPGGTGSGGAQASSSSSGVTQPTTGVSMATTDASSASASGTGGMASGSTGATTDAATGATVASVSVSSSASSSSGGPTNVPFCATTMSASEADDFNSYVLDVTFNTLGEGAGPWAETQPPSDDVLWAQNMILTTSAPAFLSRKMAINLPTPAGACAITVKLASLDGGNAMFGLVQDMASPADPNASSIVIEENSNMGYLHPFGYSYLGGPVQFPVTLGIVVRPGHLYGFFFNGSTWTPLLSMASGAPVGWLTTSTGFIRFGQRDSGNDLSRWDDYDVMPIPASILPP